MIVTILKVAAIPTGMFFGAYAGGFIGAAFFTKHDYDFGAPMIGMGVGGLVGGTAVAAALIR